MKIAPFPVALLVGLVVGFEPGMSLAQAAPEDPNGMSCARFSTLAVEEQMVALSTLEPLGDEMNAGDADASRQWAAQVTAACRDKPDRLLPEAAEDALGD